MKHVPADRQRIIYKAKMLEDDRLLSFYITENDQTIHLLAKIQNSSEDTPKTSSNNATLNSAPTNPSDISQNNITNPQNMGAVTKVLPTTSQGIIIRTATTSNVDFDGIPNGLIGDLNV